MGLYDSFILTTPAQCPVCCTGSHRDFQTKDIDCVLDYYYEGKPAVQYYWAELTEREYLNAVQMHTLLHGGRGNLFLPIFSKNSTKISHRLEDGVYPAYSFCQQCKEYIYIHAIVKDGIFIGIQEKRGMEL
jgi:hypothetical protein